MYVAVKGGETAIDNAHRLLAVERRGDPAIAELSVAQIREQLTLAVDRVMTELNAENMKNVASAPTRTPAAAAHESSGVAARGAPQAAAAGEGAVDVGDDDDEEEMAAMRERLAQLKQ